MNKTIHKNKIRKNDHAVQSKGGLASNVQGTSSNPYSIKKTDFNNNIVNIHSLMKVEKEVIFAPFLTI